MRPYVGKIIVTAIVAVTLVPPLLFAEFRYGFFQKLRFEHRAERYLATTYDEKMTIVKIRYLWDNIEPLMATAYPESDPSLRFYIYYNDDRESGLSDDYATILWKKQANEDVETLLLPIQTEYANQATIDFSCCEVGRYNYESIKGEVPHYGATGLPFNLVVNLDRSMNETDLNNIYNAAESLRKFESLSLKQLVFRFLMPDADSNVSYEIPGEALHTILSVEDLEIYNTTRLPAQYVAKQLGADLQWNEAKNEAVFSRNGTTLAVRSWGNEAILNGEPISDPVGAYIGAKMKLMVSVKLIERAFDQKLALW